MKIYNFRHPITGNLATVMRDTIDPSVFVLRRGDEWHHAHDAGLRCADITEALSELKSMGYGNHNIGLDGSNVTESVPTAERPWMPKGWPGHVVAQIW